MKGVKGGADCIVSECIGVGWSLGLACFTLVLFVLYEAGLDGLGAIGVAVVVTFGALIVGLPCIVSRRRKDLPIDADKPSIAVFVGLGLVVLQVLLAIRLAVQAPLVAWDAWAVWAFKGRLLERGSLPMDYFRDTVTAFSHPDYPLNLPLAESVLFHLGQPLGDMLAALIGPACLASLALLFYAGLSRLYGRSTAALTTAVLTLAPAIVWQAASGYADIPLALYGGGAALYLLLWWRFRRPVDGLLIAWFAAGAAWTKKEGMVIAAVVSLAYICGEALQHGQPWRGRVWSILKYSTALIPLLLPCALFTRVVHPLSSDFYPLTVAIFRANAERLPTIGLLVAQQLGLLTNWGVLWIVLLSVVPVSILMRRLSYSGYGLLLMLTAQLGIDAGGFVFSAWQPYTRHIATSLDRLVAQAVPLAVLLLVEVGASLRRRRMATQPFVALSAQQGDSHAAPECIERRAS